MISESRKRINPDHIVITGDYWRLLKDNEILTENAQTALVSQLLSLDGAKWISVMPTWEQDIGKTVGEILGENSPDIDATDRLFRTPDCG